MLLPKYTAIGGVAVCNFFSNRDTIYNLFAFKCNFSSFYLFMKDEHIYFKIFNYILFIFSLTVCLDTLKKRILTLSLR